MVSRFINICWSFFKLAVVLAVLAVVGIAVFLFTRMDDEIRRHVEHTLAERFPQLDVRVGGARLIEGQGIAVYDLMLSQTGSSRVQTKLLVVDEIMLACDAKLTRLVKGMPPVERVVLRRPQLWVSRSSRGEWNLASLWPLPECSVKRPRIIIEDAVVTLSDEGNPALPNLVLNDVTLTVDPSQANGRTHHDTRTEASSFGTPTQDLEDIVALHGHLGGPNLKRAEVHARFSRTTGTLHLDSKFHRLDLGDELLAWVKCYGRGYVDQSSLRGEINGDVALQYNVASVQAPEFEANLRLINGRLDDPRLPRPVTDLACTLQLQSGGLKIRELHGSCGSASLSLQLQREGWHRTAPLAMALSAKNVVLDQRLYQVLPNLLQTEWDKYRPTGIANAELQLTFDGQRWRPQATLTGNDLSFESVKFPYRVTNGSGTMQYSPHEANRPAVLDINLTAQGGGQPITFVGQVFDPKPGAVGWIEITGQGLDIEKSMINALKEKPREVIESLRPSGQFNVRWRLDRKNPGQTKPHSLLRLELVDCQVKYDKFPYPLSNISGLVQAEDDQWSFSDLVSGGSRVVNCHGFLRPSKAGKELWLKFTGQQIPLDDDLRSAVTPQVRQAWEALNARGSIELVSAEIHNDTGFAKPSIRVAVRPLPESATIQPKFFPYLLERLEGEISYHNGELLISNLSAHHNRTEVRSNGSGYFGDDGAWNMRLEGLSADRLKFRRDLLVALPPKLHKIIDQLRLTGGFGLHNATLQFSKAADKNAELLTQWDMQIDCHQAHLQPGIELHNVHGTVRLVGASQGINSYTAAELAIDSATFEDVQLTNIRGPLWIDDTRCLVGEWATRRQGQTPRHLTAKVYDGNVVGDAWVTYDGVPQYSATAVLTDASLLRVMRERFHGSQDFEGKLAASVTLNGSGRSLHALEGNGEVRITEANIYELPLLVGLLKVLRNATPDTTAFNQCDMKYRIRGRHVYLDKLDFLGDAVSFYGKGYTNFDHHLNLVFHGVVGRNEIRIPFVKNFVDQVGQQTFQMYVDGTLADPQFHHQALPGINNLIQQIREDLDSPAWTGQQSQAGRNSDINEFER